MVTRLQKERAKQQISKARQIQKPTTKRVPFISRKQRVVTQIAEKEAAKKQQVKSELESSGISKATTVQEYQASYEKLSPEVKRYVQTPEQVGQNVEQAKQELIQSNQALIDEKIKYYQDKKQKKHDYYRKKSKKYKEKGDSERAQRYEDKLDEYEAQYEGIIEKLQKNRNLYASFDDILRYAKEWGQYERDKEEARNENQKTKYTPPKTVEEMRQRGLEYLKKHPESFGGTAPEMVKAIEAGADIYKPLPTTKYKMYDKPISAYYDPRTGREVLQSIAPEIAKQQGLLPIEIKGVQEETGKYLVESKTGLLTSQQQAIREFYSKIKPELARELPTTFEIGVAPGKPDIMQIFEPSKSAYEIAAVSKPYSKKELAVMEYKKSPEEFIKKYGYMPTETGEIGAVAGMASPVTATDITALAVPGASISTRLAIIANSRNFEKLSNPKTSNKTKMASLKEIAISFGSAALGAAAFGTAAKYSDDALSAAGVRVLSNILKGGGSHASKIARNIAGLSLVGAGKLTRTAIETYFKKEMISEGIEIARAAKEKQAGEVAIKTFGLAGTMFGFKAGEMVGKKAFDISSMLSGRYVKTRLEEPIKRAPSAIQAEILTAEEPFYGYRRGPVETGLEFQPRLDLYLSGKIKQPTETVFFRFEETTGVKGGEILPSLSVPGFVQPPKYKDMFLSNLRAKKDGMVKGIIRSLAETPVLTDVLTVGKFETKKIPEELRKKLVKELATTGKVKESTQKELLKHETLISDKLRELKFQEEQEAVFRERVKLKDSMIGFTRNPSGKIIPVIYEKGTLKPRLSVLKNKKIITDQDAKFIERQFNMWKKFNDAYVLPKQHSIAHSKAVMKNVEKIIMVYPEYHTYLIKKYGSVQNAIKEIQKGARIHDLGKTAETSQEFGTPHGEKVYEVYKAGLLPKEVANIKPEVARAIKNHETIAGTPKGRFTMKYKVYDFFKRYSIEEKILATADRLDLIRYNMKIDPRRLPLGDALNRLKIEKQKATKIERVMAKPVEYREVPEYLVPVSPKKYEPGMKKYKPKKPARPEYKKPKEYKTPRYPQNYLVTTKPYKPKKPARPEYPPITPTPEVPVSPMQLLTPPKEKPVKKARKPKKKIEKKVLPTLTQQILGIKGKKAIKRPTGFEAVRII